jgi:pyruvate dehydrogenase E1 component alpha subunit
VERVRQNPLRLSRATRLSLYRRVKLIRRCEEYILRHYPENEMTTPMHMSMGQEAVPAAVCEALGDDCEAVASYRSHATFLARTGSSKLFFGELYGRETGTADGKGGSMHLAALDLGHFCSSAVVGAGFAVAAGMAFANKRQGTNKIATVFFGDGAVDEGVFWETLNSASVMHLPMLFVLEDNGYAVNTPPSARHGFRSVEGIVRQFDCGFMADHSNDAESLCDTTRTVVGMIRDNGGPGFIHARCCRYLEHVGIGDDIDDGYRSREEVDAWRARDAVDMLRARLAAEGFAADLDRIDRTLEEEISQSVSTARAAPLPARDKLFHGVFHETA